MQFKYTTQHNTEFLQQMQEGGLMANDTMRLTIYKELQ